MSSDKSDSEEHDVISRQIVDYYKKYSQTKHLPKYFSGSPLSYMPPIVKEEDLAPQPEPIIIIEDTSEYPKPVSPTSSVTSNRKLEWDNGADIGYNNLKLQKSVSLPILTDDKDLEYKGASGNFIKQVVTVISYPSSSDDAEKKEVYSSSLSPPIQAQIPETSSSSGKTISKNVSSSSSSTRYLKCKIGSPNAESTPKIGVPNFKKRTIALSTTKPITIHCVGEPQKKNSNKIVQTSLVFENVAKSVQTSFENVSKPENQSVVVIHYDNQNDGSTDEKAPSSDSSKELPVLSQLISKKQSKNLVDDVDRSIELLQKLMKSKKYDAATKKRYIKKIVQKIVDSKYNEDSTTSSELFVPKPHTKLSVKTCKDEFLPQRAQKSIFVVSQPEEVQKQNSSSDYSVQSKQSSGSWKEDKTDSERLLEQKQEGQGDHLVKFAKKERQHQLGWIKDEISHLTKLKGLLENQVQKTTTVYMMSKPDLKGCFCSGSYTSSCSCSSGGSRNYIIETEFVGSPKVPQNYNLNGKGTYVVSSPDENPNPNVVGEIKVDDSDDQITKIKIKTKKEISDKVSLEIPLSSSETPIPCTCLKGKTSKQNNVLTVVDPSRNCYCCGCKKNAAKGKKQECFCCMKLRENAVEKILTKCTQDNCLCCKKLRQLGSKKFGVEKKKSEEKLTDQYKSVIDDKSCFQSVDESGKEDPTSDDENLKLIPSAKHDHCQCCRKLREKGSKYADDLVEKYKMIFLDKKKKSGATKDENFSKEKLDQFSDVDLIENQQPKAQSSDRNFKSDTKEHKRDPTSDVNLTKNVHRVSDPLALDSQATIQTKDKIDDFRKGDRTSGLTDNLQFRAQRGSDPSDLGPQPTILNQTDDFRDTKIKMIRPPTISDTYVTSDTLIDEEDSQKPKYKRDLKPEGRDEKGGKKPPAISNKQKDNDGDNNSTALASRLSDKTSTYSTKEFENPKGPEDPETLAPTDKDQKFSTPFYKTHEDKRSSADKISRTSDRSTQITPPDKKITSDKEALAKISNDRSTQIKPIGKKTSDKEIPVQSSYDRISRTSDKSTQSTDRGTKGSKRSTDTTSRSSDKVDRRAFEPTSDRRSSDKSIQSSDKNLKSDKRSQLSDNRLITDDQKYQSDKSTYCFCNREQIHICTCDDSTQSDGKKSAQIQTSTKQQVSAEVQTSVKSKNAYSGDSTDKQYESSQQFRDTDDTDDRKVSPLALQESSLTETSTSSYSSSISSTSSIKSCVCCKRQNVTSQRLYHLKKKLSNQAYPLCRPCFQQTRSYPPNFYNNPAHVCACYTVIQTTTLNEIKQTITDLNELDEFCTCVKSGDRGGCCKHCQGKLKKTSKSRHGIAYTLTLEDQPVQENAKKKKHKKRYLEEIKIKIPVVAKKNKDKENKRKKKDYDRHKNKRRDFEGGASLKKGGASLQDYLSLNRPGFVEEAEGRRKTVNQSRNQREEMSDYNKLQFLMKAQEDCLNNCKRLFTGKEMKEITKRNYNKLPEVQQKMQDNREKQLREANRLMADTFNRKLRENVLKGKKDLPTNCRLICF